MGLLAVSQEGVKMGHEADNSPLPTTDIKKCVEMHIFIKHWINSTFIFTSILFTIKKRKDTNILNLLHHFSEGD
jgi:hypothetical protein